MNSITIDGVETALEAASWCKQQNFKWSIELPLLNDVANYTFKFERSIDASLFALRWAGA